jgi:hypothetical protein
MENEKLQEKLPESDLENKLENELPDFNERERIRSENGRILREVGKLLIQPDKERKIHGQDYLM